MITEEQYTKAVSDLAKNESIIWEYHLQKQRKILDRIESGEPFTDDELVYSAGTFCSCGHGLAYPKGAPPNHYWDCSAILKGIGDILKDHCGQLPFVYYDIKSENQRHQGRKTTTRGIIRPLEKEGK